jgi:pimeloyl-ACP methyl ester carboxylesterase
MKKVISLILIILSITIVYAEKTSINVEKNGNGNPIIFIPGLGCPGEIWNETVNYFSDKYECHVVSIAGFAGMEATEAITLDKIKNDIIKYVKKNKLKNCLLIGHSLGASLTLRIASTEPDLFSALIILDVYPFPLASIIPDITQEQAELQANTFKNQILNQSDTEFKNSQKASLGLLTSNEEDLSKILNWMIQSDRQTIAQAYYGMFSTDLRNCLNNIDCPVLVIGTWISGKSIGFNKELIRNKFKEQYRNLLNCDIIIAETANHYIMLDDPEWLIGLIDKFLG